MIQSPALIPATLLALPGNNASATNGDVAQSADFGALLAISVTLPTAEDATAEPAPATALPATAITADPAMPATSGNALPLALPPPAADADSDAQPLPMPLSLSAPATRSAPRAKTAITKEPSASPKVAHGEHKTPAIAAEESAAAVEPDPALAPLTAQPDAVVAVVLAQPDPIQAAPAPLSVATKQEKPAAAVPAPMLHQLSITEPEVTALPRPDRPAATPQPRAQAAFEHAAPQAAFLRAPAAPGEPLPIADQFAAQPNTPAPIRLLRIEIALPEQVTAVIRAVRPVASRLLALIEPENFSAPVFAASSLAPPALVQTATQPAPLERPQDFTALLDRLVAAREAAAPQRVSITLPHAEFGPVHLRFRQEDGALAVTMTSADPEFARAASQAAPPVMLVAESRAASGSANNSDHSANASNTAPGQQRGQSAERRSDAASNANPSPRSAGRDKPARRHGIFA